MANHIATYDPKKIALTLGVGKVGLIVKDYADGSILGVSFPNDATTMTSGAQGSTHYNENPMGDYAEITFSVLRSSDINTALMLAIASKTEFPVSVNDANYLGDVSYAGSDARFKKKPDVSYEVEGGAFEYTIMIPHLKQNYVRL